MMNSLLFNDFVAVNIDVGPNPECFQVFQNELLFLYS